MFVMTSAKSVASVVSSNIKSLLNEVGVWCHCFMSENFYVVICTAIPVLLLGIRFTDTVPPRDRETAVGRIWYWVCITTLYASPIAFVLCLAALGGLNPWPTFTAVFAGCVTFPQCAYLGGQLAGDVKIARDGAPVGHGAQPDKEDRRRRQENDEE